MRSSVVRTFSGSPIPLLTTALSEGRRLYTVHIMNEIQPSVCGPQFCLRPLGPTLVASRRCVSPKLLSEFIVSPMAENSMNSPSVSLHVLVFSCERSPRLNRLSPMQVSTTCGDFLWGEERSLLIQKRVIVS